MLNAKFKDHPTFCSEQEDSLKVLPYMCLGHLGHVA